MYVYLYILEKKREEITIVSKINGELLRDIKQE